MRRLKSSSFLVATTLATLVLLAISALSTPGYAQVKPGDFITPENATKVKDLVGPGVYYKVEHGMSMKIVPTERVDWPPPYKDATEKYSSQVRLSQDKRVPGRLCRRTAVPVDRRQRSRRRGQDHLEQRLPPDHFG